MPKSIVVDDKTAALLDEISQETGESVDHCLARIVGRAHHGIVPQIKDKEAYDRAQEEGLRNGTIVIK